MTSDPERPEDPWSPTDLFADQELAEEGIRLVASVRAWAALASLGLMVLAVGGAGLAALLLADVKGGSFSGDALGPLWAGLCMGLGGVGVGLASLFLVIPLARPAPRDAETAAQTLRWHLWAWRVLAVSLTGLALLAPGLLCGMALVGEALR